MKIQKDSIEEIEDCNYQALYNQQHSIFSLEEQLRKNTSYYERLANLLREKTEIIDEIIKEVKQIFE